MKLVLSPCNNIKMAQMSQVMSVVPRTVQRQLAALQKQGIVIREGNTSAKKWIVSGNVSDIPTDSK